MSRGDSSGLLSIDSERRSWCWRLLDPMLRGAQLLDPTVAQHTPFIRIPSAITARNIATLIEAAEEHKRQHAREGEESRASETSAPVGTGSSDVPGKIYLHHNGLNKDVAAIVSHIQSIVEGTDAIHFGLLADSEVMADGPMVPRCVEFHEYAQGEREVCESHYDSGSLFTADVMLSDCNEFEGGAMQGTAIDASGIANVTDQTFERGDLLVFLSHKAHSVARLRGGRRCVLVIEFWQGGVCTANHRCCDGGSRCDPLCGNREGAASYYSRYTRDDEESSADVHADDAIKEYTMDPADTNTNRHNYLDGPPFLRCSCPHALLMLQALYPTAERTLQLRASELSVWVDWGDMLPAAEGAYRLSIRRLGVQVARAQGKRSLPLCVSFDRQGDDCTPFLAELSWDGGRRQLHVTPPPMSRLSFDGLVLPPLSHPRGLVALKARIEAAESHAPPLLARTSQLERGFGIEIELLTEAAAWPLPAPGIGKIEKEEHRHEHIRAVIASLRSESCKLEEGPHTPLLVSVDAALKRCGQWRSDVDVMVQPTPHDLATRMLHETAALSAVGDSQQRDEALKRCMHMLQRDYGSRKSEFTSPMPPSELRFSRGAALEISCFVDGVLASTGAVAASISSACHSATATHVHINVSNPLSGGTVLSAMQICDVVLAWIRFDLVTQRFARPWLWCEPSCAPMYATGAELGTLDHLTWQKVTEAEVMEDIATPCAFEGNGDDKKYRCVPTFVRALHAMVNADDFGALSEADKMDSLFGIGGPGADLGRECSLNLSAIAKYGTLEVRRFHGTLDATLLTRWAAFCVSFVEVFAATASPILRLPTGAAALEALQLSQETASADELLACMAGFVDPGTAKYFEGGLCFVDDE